MRIICTTVFYTEMFCIMLFFIGSFLTESFYIKISPSAMLSLVLYIISILAQKWSAQWMRLSFSAECVQKALKLPKHAKGVSLRHCVTVKSLKLIVIALLIVHYSPVKPVPKKSTWRRCDSVNREITKLQIRKTTVLAISDCCDVGTCRVRLK